MIKINIVLATFNPNVEFFEKQINSIKNQTFIFWRCYILDDYSDQNSFGIIKSTIEELNDNRFILRRNETNLGSFRTFLKGIEESSVLYKSEFTALCDQDDVWDKDKLKIQYELIKQNNYILVHSDARIINSSDNVISESLFLYEKRIYLTPNFYQLLIKNTVTGCSILFNTKISNYINWKNFKKPPHYHHDLYIAMIASKLGSIGVITAPLLGYRFHSNNVVGPQRYEKNITLLYKMLFFFTKKKYILNILNIYNFHKSIYDDVSKALEFDQEFNPIKFFFKNKFRFKGNYILMTNLIFCFILTKIFKNIIRKDK